MGTDIPVAAELPIIKDVDVIEYEPVAIVDRRIRKRFNQAVVEGLIIWKGRGADAQTWEILTDLQKRFPHFDLGDKIQP